MIRDTIRGRVGYLLFLVALLHFIYPITVGDDSANLVVYNLLYTGMFIAGIFVASDSRQHLIATVVTAAFYLVCSLVYSLDPTNTVKAFFTYIAILPFQATIVYLLFRYIFKTRIVNLAVLFAAITIYILLGSMFVPLYGITELLQPGSFVDNLLPGARVFWQQFVYFSLTTLTTTGYGDIAPKLPWARALSNVESVIGVLYMAVLMARLVGLYSREEQTEKEK